HIPPMYSAKRVKGVRLYKLARQNIIVEREPVNVSILEISLNNFNKNEIDFSVTCSKGTYIRVLGQDIAKKLGTIGYLTKLVRIEVGPYNINNSTSIKTFEEKWKSTNR
ncbi:MAG: tRNA pseudouridine(55) synthase TruB, partial [Candidatus Marinimicrobia bacterium]|nr:tRNA pseudouridine(55) synthase TruB [Candidatus Neomarinimicrobiota bacterium]